VAFDVGVGGRETQEAPNKCPARTSQHRDATHQVTSPRASCCGSNESSLFTAPRALKLPVTCSLSSFKYASQPPAEESQGEGSRGVLRTNGAIRCAAPVLAAARLDRTPDALATIAFCR